MHYINEFIVYKKEVCQIKNILKNSLNQDCYLLSPVLDDTLTIKIPITTNDLRNIIKKEQVEQLIKKIPSIGIIDPINKNMENEYHQLLTTGNPEDLIKIIKTTYLRNKERTDHKKRFLERDDYYFNLAEKYLYSEFMIALNMNYEDTKKYVANQVNTLTN